MTRAKTVVDEAAGQMIQTLRLEKSRADGTYPLPLSRLIALSAAGAGGASWSLSDADIEKALKTKAFQQSAIVLASKDRQAPVALAEDAQLLVEHPASLLYLLEKSCSAEYPLVGVDRITKPAETALRKPLAAAIIRHISSQSLPPGVGVRLVKKKPYLYLDRFPPKSPETELAEKLLAALRKRRDSGQDYPSLLSSLVKEARIASKQVASVMAEQVFSSAALLVPLKKSEALVALREDRDRLAGDPRLVETLVQQSCTSQNPHISVASLAGKLPTELQGPFFGAVSRMVQEASLPRGIDSRLIDEELCLSLAGLVHPVSAKVVLLVDHLHTLRETSDTGYPPTWEELLAVLPDRPGPATVKKLVAHSDFQTNVQFASKPGPVVPVALAGDVERLAGSQATLAFAVGATCTARLRAVSLTQLAAKLNAPLRDRFLVAARRFAERNDLPEGVGALLLDGEPLFYRQDLPPEAALLLTEKLLRLLRQRKAGQGDYPATLGKLLAEIGDEATPTLRQGVLKYKGFTQRVILPGEEPETPVVLAGDGDVLAGSDLLLTHVLAVAQTASDQAFPPEVLKKKVDKSLRKLFGESLMRRIESQQLPEGVGAVKIKKKVYLFRFVDILGQGAIPPRPLQPMPRPEPGPAKAAQILPDFASAFTAAFERLDRQRGGHNFVSLVDLRRELPDFDRPTFDAGLARLRRSGQFTLSAAEGRYGITPAEQEAGIREGGMLLLFVARRSPLI